MFFRKSREFGQESGAPGMRLTGMNTNKAVEDLGEEGIIRLIQQSVFKKLPAYVKKGIGDDCAVLETVHGRILLVTTDTLIEGIHFTSGTISPDALGWKALAINVSDIAAMGGRARTAFLSIALKQGATVRLLESFMAGFNTFAGKAGVVLAGGDTIESPGPVVITVALLGDCLKEHVVYRSGARPGDDVWVTGPLGDAAGGLFVLQHKEAFPNPEYKSLVDAHQRPTPPFELGKAIAESGLVHAMIDISDGVAKDLRHICEQGGVGAVVQARAIPMSRDLLRLAAVAEKDPLQWAIYGGEDYELLFAAPPAHRKKILAMTEQVPGRAAVKIGRVIEGRGIWFETEKGTKRLEPGGYVHFSR